jgi:hypothetical protein
MTLVPEGYGAVADGAVRSGERAAFEILSRSQEVAGGSVLKCNSRVAS